jgi:acylphosphatase
MAEVHHERVFFSGRVQGVGFRYTALQVSREYDVAGFVANLPDGRVHLEAEGDKTQVTEFVAAIEERMHGHIKKVERSHRLKIAELSGFSIH